MPSRSQEIGEESRQRILDAAEELFAKQGFVETSIANVADLSGISRGSIPWHFTNKEGLLMAVVKRATERERVTSPTAPGLDGLGPAMKNNAQLMRQPHMALLHTLLAHASRPESGIRDAYLEFHESDRALISEWLELSPDLRVPGMDIETLAMLVYSLVIGIHVQWRVAPEHIDLEQSLDSIEPLLRAVFAPKADDS